MPIQFLFTVLFAYAVAMTWRRAFASSVSYVAAGLWTIFWVVAGVVVWRPEVTNGFAWALGIGRGADLVLYMSIAALFYALFRQTIRLERMDRQMTTVVQQLAIDAWKKEYEQRS